MSSETINYTTLVLGPGGIKGFLQLGSLFVLEKKEKLVSLKRIVGVSIGSIIGCLYTSGFTIPDIIRKAVSVDMLTDINSLDFKGVSSHKGLISNEFIKNELEESMREKFGMIPTLYQHYLATGMEFVSVVSNLTKKIPEHLSYKNYPNLSIVDAVLMSMNIPLLFYRMTYQGSTYIDGAFMDPFPVTPYDNGEEEILVITVEVGDEKDRGDVFQYIHGIIHSTMTRLKDLSMRSMSSKVHHICIAYPTYDVTGISIDSLGKGKMVAIGYDVAEQFLKKTEVNEETIIIASGSKIPIVKKNQI
jgi:predicted acylesterase/phospholipase RssA